MIPADLAFSGARSAQHYDQNQTWPTTRRLIQHKVRILGQDPLTLNPIPDFNTHGYEHGGAVWLANYGANAAPPDPAQAIQASMGGFVQTVAKVPSLTAARDTPVWAQAFPTVVSSAPGSKAYKSKVKGVPNTLPQLQQDPQSLAWQDDNGLLPTPSVPPLGMGVPVGMPGITLPFSTIDQQQQAFVPAGGVLIAVWRGGFLQGSSGSRVYDVTGGGAIDTDRWARVHSSWRVYRLPTQGAITFGGQNAPPPGGLAWQLGYDVDGQAGNGVMTDLPTRAGTLLVTEKQDPTKPETISTGTGTVSLAKTARAFLQAPNANVGTQAKSNAGGGPATVAVSNVPQLAVASWRGTGPIDCGGADCPHVLATTPDAERVLSAHLTEAALFRGGTGDAPRLYDPAPWVKASAGGPLWVETPIRNDLSSTHVYAGGSAPGLRRRQTPSFFGVPGLGTKPIQDKIAADKAGLLDKTQVDKSTDPSTDKSDPSSDGTTTGHKTNPASDVTLPKQDFDKATNPASDSGTPRPVLPGFGGTPAPTSGTGEKTSRGDISTPPPLTSPIPTQTLPPASPFLPSPRSGTKPYGSSPTEVGIPTLLGVPQTIGDDGNGSDARNAVGVLSDQQQQEWNKAAVAVALQAFGNQTGFAPQKLAGDQSGYPNQVYAAGGWAFTPGGYDLVRAILGLPQANTTQPASAVAFVAGTTLDFGTPTIAGVVAQGYRIKQTAQAANANQLSIYQTDANGVIQTPAVLEATCTGASTSTLKTSGNPVVSVPTTATSGQVPTATGSGQNYAWATPSAGSSNPPVSVIGGGTTTAPTTTINYSLHTSGGAVTVNLPQGSTTTGQPIYLFLTAVIGHDTTVNLHAGDTFGGDVGGGTSQIVIPSSTNYAVLQVQYRSGTDWEATYLHD